jgi:hypothetical protein
MGSASMTFELEPDASGWLFKPIAQTWALNPTTPQQTASDVSPSVNSAWSMGKCRISIELRRENRPDLTRGQRALRCRERHGRQRGDPSQQFAPIHRDRRAEATIPAVGAAFVAFLLSPRGRELLLSNCLLATPTPVYGVTDDVPPLYAICKPSSAAATDNDRTTVSSKRGLRYRISADAAVEYTDESASTPQ